jgi:hypothetical protein
VIAPSARGESVVEPLSWAPGVIRSCRPDPSAHQSPYRSAPEQVPGRRWSAPSQHKPDRTEHKGRDTRSRTRRCAWRAKQRTPLAAVERPRAFASAMGSKRVLDRALAARQALQPRSGALSLRQQPAGETNQRPRSGPRPSAASVVVVRWLPGRASRAGPRAASWKRGGSPSGPNGNRTRLSCGPSRRQPKGGIGASQRSWSLGRFDDVAPIRRGL